MAGERVLVIDDDAESQEVLEKLVLRPNGYRVLSARDGEEGLQLAFQERPDLIILDLQIPRMDGLEVLEALREQGVDIPVIFTTIYGSEETAVRAFRLGARDYMIKPFRPQEMQEAIARALTEVRLRRERDQLHEQLLAANEQLQRQLQELNALYSIGKSVTSLLDLGQVLNRVVEAAVYLARGEEGVLLLLDEESGELYLRAAKNVDEKLARGLRIRVEDSVAGRVIHSERPVLLTGERLKIATGYLVNALLYVPLRAPDRGVIGVLGVANRQAGWTFAERDVHLLSALADYAAVAIENARLFSAVEMERGKLEAILREAEEAVIVVDQDGNVLLCNTAAHSALGLGADVVNRPVIQMVTQPALRELFAQAQEAERTLRGEIPLDDGRTFNAQLTPVEGVGQVLMMQDITRLKELDRIKSEFVSTVSHDLRTPLTTIRGYVDLLPRVGPLTEQQMQFVGYVQSSMVAITELIGDLLDIGRIEAGFDLEMGPCRLEEVIAASVEEFRPRAAEKRQELYWEMPEALPLVQGNPRRLRQVMDNLIANGIKYTQEGGWVAVSAMEEDGHVVVRVADNGIGIPPADQPYIFDKFYRVESAETQDIKGTGLGLTIVKSVIEKHGGRVWVESRPGVGSVFTFVLQAVK